LSEKEREHQELLRARHQLVSHRSDVARQIRASSCSLEFLLLFPASFDGHKSTRDPFTTRLAFGNTIENDITYVFCHLICDDFSFLDDFR